MDRLHDSCRERGKPERHNHEPLSRCIEAYLSGQVVILRTIGKRFDYRCEHRGDSKPHVAIT